MKNTEETVVQNQRRQEYRENGITFQYPVAFELRAVSGKSETWGPVRVETINYHHRGACFRIPNHLREEFFRHLEDAESWAVDIYHGKIKIREQMPLRICWTENEETATCGVQFEQELKEHQFRAPRLTVNKNFPASIVCSDPVDANRELYFNIIDVSETGMLISTSLTNRHIVSGMVFEKMTVTFPGKYLQECLSLKVANTRATEDGKHLLLGVQITNQSDEFKEFIRTYLSLFALTADKEQRVDELSQAGFMSKRLKKGLTYRVVNDESTYKKVLELRYEGYKRAGKLKKDAGLESAGEGLRNEGLIIAAYLGAQMVAAMEFRFLSDRKDSLRTAKYFDLDDFIKARPDRRIIEINKLVVHPKVQGTDVVVGMNQKIHSILVQKGGFDVLVSATDNLVPFYRKFGFKECGKKCVHPSNPQMNLNMLVLPKEAYMSAAGMNPFAWSVVYEISQKYLESIGIAPKQAFTPLQAMQYQCTKLLYSIKNRKSAFKGSAKPVAKSAQTVSDSGVDAKWTEPHFLSVVMLPYLLEADRIIGVNKVDEIMALLQMPRSFISKQGNWVSIAFFNAFQDEYQKYGDLSELNRASGLRSLRPDVFGMKYYVVKHLMSPKSFFNIFEKQLPDFNRTRTYKVTELGPGHVQIKVGVTKRHLLPKHRESCKNWEANFLGVLRLMTNKSSKVVKTACCFNGDEACEYEMIWNPNLRFLPKLTFAASWTLACAGVFYYLSQSLNKEHNSVKSMAIGLAIGLTALIAAYIRKTLQYGKLYESFNNFEESSNERYQLLQLTKDQLGQRLEELVLIEDTTRSVMRNNDLHGIFKETLDSICKKFNFSRAFIMLADEKNERLQVAAIGGAIQSSEVLWKFNVDARVRRDSPLLLSSVFHSLSSIVINDIETHMPLLNEASKEIINALGVNGFAIVPIPSDSGCRGVIVADKSVMKAEIDENDLQLLERVGQQLGVALDKHQILQNEKTKTALFQKFVPAYAKSEMFGLTEANVGWQVKDTVAMFVDVKNYTAVTALLPPNAVAKLVNEFYSLTSACARKHGGYVDKFIGDAALVTWGYLDPLGANSDKAVQCALDIMAGLDDLNSRLREFMIPEIGVTIGMDRGESVCGLFGSDERMEFTGIGSVLNRASRLQSLCKELQTPLVLSDTIHQSLGTEHLASIFNGKDGISIRGFNGQVRVYYYSENSYIKAA